VLVPSERLLRCDLNPDSYGLLVETTPFFNREGGLHQTDLFIYLFIYGVYCLIRSFVHSFIRSFVHSFIRSFVHSFIRSFVHSFIRPFVHSSIRPFVHSFIRSFVHSFIRSFVHSFIRSFVHLFIRSFVHSFIRSFVHSFIDSYDSINKKKQCRKSSCKKSNQLSVEIRTNETTTTR